MGDHYKSIKLGPHGYEYVPDGDPIYTTSQPVSMSLQDRAHIGKAFSLDRGTEHSAKQVPPPTVWRHVLRSL